MSQALRKLTSVISKTNTVVIFINQLREKVGVMYGNPETTTGGKALKFYATIRIDVRKSEAIKEGKEIIGNRTKITIKKNKVAPPFSYRKSVTAFLLSFELTDNNPTYYLTLLFSYGVLTTNLKWEEAK